MFDQTILINGGSKQIGATSLPLSRPIHTVKIQAFRLMIGTVTNQQYAQFVSAGGYRDATWWTAIAWRWRQSKKDLIPAFWHDPSFNQAKQPIIGISWYEATAFARWLSSESGHHWRLPTEIEWEVATQNKGTGNIHSAGSGIPHPIDAIGTGYVSDNGLWNMRGNIWEWCSTAWGRNWQHLDYPYPYQANDGREDQETSFARVMRGGSWFDPIQEAHPCKRARFLPGSRASNIGFRLACDVVDNTS